MSASLGGVNLLVLKASFTRSNVITLSDFAIILNAALILSAVKSWFESSDALRNSENSMQPLFDTFTRLKIVSTSPFYTAAWQCFWNAVMTLL